jgi:hypothetical protein
VSSDQGPPDVPIVLTRPFSLARPLGPVISRIPKGARPRASAELEKRLRAVISSPEDLNAWSGLLHLASSLVQPPRGGKQRSLTSQIILQLGNDGGTTGSRVGVGRASSGRKPMSDDDLAVRRASIKLQEGDVRGAARCLASDERMAPLSEDTVKTMRAKHPPCPLDRREPPTCTGGSLSISGADIRAAIRAFKPGSAGGRDGLRPQHLKDLADGPAGILCDVLADFANLVLAGRVPFHVRPIFFGATLLPFAKKGGGLRPVAVGLTLRRLVAKAASRAVSSACSSIFAPRQLGVCTKGGTEALVHAARRYLEHKAPGRALVKLDFSNAFNSLRRDCMLEAVANQMPGLLPLALSSYGAPSCLWLGDETLSSEEGVQQGDPLGPLLFCLTVQPLLVDSKCEFVSGYLDDVGLGDEVSCLAERVNAFEAAAALLGLSLNHTKCEVLGLDSSDLLTWQGTGLNFVHTASHDACLLGSPLSAAGVDAALMSCHEHLAGLAPRLKRLAAHEAFFLLKNCFAVPQLQYILRSSPAYASASCADLVILVRDLLSSILNVQLDGVASAQASLPVRLGGLGIRDIGVLSSSAFLSSLSATGHLVNALLPVEVSRSPDPAWQAALDVWHSEGGGTAPPTEAASRQRSWDDLICVATFNHLLQLADQSSRARLLAVASPDAGAWLNVLPCRNLGLCLSDRELRVAVGLRLGAPLVRPHTCVCGATVDCWGHHGLSCKRSAGRQRRHAQANEVLVRAIRSVEIQAELEPHLSSAVGGMRPDGATLDPWCQGRTLVWDFTCPDTLAASYVAQSAALAGTAAGKAENNKRLKYAQLAASGSIFFSPVAIETLGTWGESAAALCRDIGSRLARISGDPRSLTFLKQRLGLAVQRGNAASVVGTCPIVDVAL